MVHASILTTLSSEVYFSNHEGSSSGGSAKRVIGASIMVCFLKKDDINQSINAIGAVDTIRYFTQTHSLMKFQDTNFQGSVHF